MEFKVVVGSWGAYNSDNEKALGSDWIDFAQYNSWEEIEKELENQGFDLEGEDEELFIQDTDFEFGDFSGDYTHPKTLFNILKTTGALKSENSYKEALAYMEVEDFDSLLDLVNEKGEDWDSNISFYEDLDSYDWAREQIIEMFPKQYEYIFKNLDSYIDYNDYFNNSNATETKYGVIEIY